MGAGEGQFGVCFFFVKGLEIRQLCEIFCFFVARSDLIRVEERRGRILIIIIN